MGNLVILVVVKHSTPFLVSWFHFIPGLVLVSSYSVLVLFLSETRKRSAGATFGDTRGRHTMSVGMNTLSYIAPSLIASNITLYVLFAAVGSLAHMRHAHREFRIAGSLFIGILHLLLSILWLVNATAVLVALVRRGSRLLELERSLIKDPSRHEELGDESVNSNHTDELGGEDFTRLKLRLVCLSLLCPVMFLTGGILEIMRGLAWMDRRNSVKNYYTEFTLSNLLIYFVEIIPVIVCITTFAQKPRQNYIAEPYALSLNEESPTP